jgi:hypothetical protein
VRRLRDLGSLIGVVLTAPLTRRPVRAHGDEAERPLPGDELLGETDLEETQAITIGAPPAEIWPWLVQMGCRRAGWYSYDGLDNGGEPSAEELVPELQELAVGDVLPATPSADDGFVVRVIEPPRTLVLSAEAPRLYASSWAFSLEPQGESSTRLVTRSRVAPFGRRARLLLRVLLQPIHFGMQRRQLLGLRERVERAAAAGPT